MQASHTIYYYNKSELKKWRKYSKAMIKALGEPSHIDFNPHGSKMYLWTKTRVAEFEKTKEFKVLNDRRISFTPKEHLDH